jgi:hypothetical protein
VVLRGYTELYEIRKKEQPMKWSKPTLVPLVMNAEIGAYQNDFDGDFPPFVKAEANRASTAREPSRGAVPSAPRESARV